MSRWHPIAVAFGAAALCVVWLLARSAAAAEDPAAGDLRDIRVGSHASELPDAGYVRRRCAGGGWSNKFAASEKSDAGAAAAVVGSLTGSAACVSIGSAGGGSTSTMLPHLGQVKIWPITDSSRTLKRA